MTTVYLIRHSEPFKVHRGIEDVKDNFLLSNIKTPLSVVGEKLAEQKSLNSEFDNLDVVWSSSYVRAMSTAKYFAYRNNIKVNITDRLGERVHGVESASDIPVDFEKKQFIDPDYKVGFGESQNEVRDRMYSILMELVEANKGKRMAIVTHATAMSYLLMKWCSIEYVDDKLKYSYKDKELLHGYLDYCETFKLEFDDNNEIIDIDIIK